MRTTRMMAVWVLMIGSGLAVHVIGAQQVGLSRKDLQRHDLSAPGREVVQVRVQIDPGVRHPGTGTPARRSSICSRARWSIKSTASRR